MSAFRHALALMTAALTVSLTAQLAMAVEIRSYGHVTYDGTNAVIENDSGDFTVTMDGPVFKLTFDREIRGAVVTTGASVPYIDAPYIFVEAVGPQFAGPRQLDVALIRNGGGTLLDRGFGFWFMLLDSGAAGRDGDKPKRSSAAQVSPGRAQEWSPNDEKATPVQYRACFVNKTYSPVNLTIVRPGAATIVPLSAGEHYRGWLYRGQAVFVSSDPANGEIMAHKKHDVAGETTVNITPSDITFVRGVQACLQHAE